MGMLKSITLQNYKCFKDKTTIDIAPLTVLCGVNSSGKSSILKSLLMLKQSYENDSPYNEMLFNGDYVDNGFFNDIIYHQSPSDIKENNSFKISNTFTLKDTSDETGYNPVKRQDISSFRELKRIYNRSFQVDSFEIESSIEVALKNKDNDTEYEQLLNDDTITPFIENNYIKSFSINIYSKNKSGNYLGERCGNITISKAVSKDIRIYDIKCEHIPNNFGKFINKSFTCTCYFSNMHLSNIYQKNMNDEIKALRPVLLSICNIVSLQFKGISFIAPLRHNPERNYLIKGNVNSVGITGEDMPVLLGKIHDKEILTDLFCNQVNTLPIEDGRVRISYLNLIQQWMDYLNLGHIDLNGGSGFIGLNISGHSIADVGFGVSQTLPIIVQGIYMSKDQTLLLEQPEIHLHPQMQLNMADFLITLAQRERNIILETHSDHIVNRIIKRAMENPELVNDDNPTIRIIFLDKDEFNASPTKVDIHIDKYKGVTNGNRNFFTQFGFETMEIAKTGYENHKRDIKK